MPRHSRPLVLVSMLAVAAPLSSPAIAQQPAVSVFHDLLNPEMRADAAHIERDLAAAGFRVTRCSADQLVSSVPGNVLVYPAGARYPAGSEDSIRAFLKRGGRLLVLGGPAFTEPAWKQGTAWKTWTDLKAGLESAASNHVVVDFTKPEFRAGWERATNDMNSHGSATVGDFGGARGPSLQIDMANLTGWDNWGLPVSGWPAGRNLLAFNARGDKNTGQLLVELREEDGSRWMGVAQLTPESAIHHARPRRLPLLAGQRLERARRSRRPHPLRPSPRNPPRSRLQPHAHARRPAPPLGRLHRRAAGPPPRRRPAVPAARAEQPRARLQVLPGDQCQKRGVRCANPNRPRQVPAPGKPHIGQPAPTGHRLPRGSPRKNSSPYRRPRFARSSRGLCRVDAAQYGGRLCGQRVGGLRRERPCVLRESKGPPRARADRAPAGGPPVPRRGRRCLLRLPAGREANRRRRAPRPRAAQHGFEPKFASRSQFAASVRPATPGPGQSTPPVPSKR